MYHLINTGNSTFAQIINIKINPNYKCIFAQSRAGDIFILSYESDFSNLQIVLLIKTEIESFTKFTLIESENLNLHIMMPSLKENTLNLFKLKKDYSFNHLELNYIQLKGSISCIKSYYHIPFILVASESESKII